MTSARLTREIRTIDAHVAGAPVRLVVGGWPVMTGRTFVERISRLRRQCDHLRAALVGEPRGHEAMTGAILVEPTDASAHAGIAFMHPDGWSAYCGHALMGAAAIALARGLVHRAGDTPLRFETAAGTLDVSVDPSGRRVRAMTPQATLLLPAAVLNVGGRPLPVDLAWCDGVYVLTDAEALGVALDLSHRDQRAALADEVRGAVARAAARRLPRERRRIEGVTFLAPDEAGNADVRSVTVYAGGVADRSPGAGATAALACVLEGMDVIPPDRPLVHRGPRGVFAARVAERTQPDGAAHPVLRVEVESDVHVTGEHTFWLEPDDPSVPRRPTRSGPLPRSR
jgi:proline racemase